MAMGLAFVAALGAATNNPLASAHGGDAGYESVITRLSPAVRGMTVEVPAGGSHLKLTNRTGRDLTVLGYEGEPFARILADGTVQENRNSPAYWLNKDELGNAPVPRTAVAKAKPNWRTLDSTGSHEWHDHRVHWMGGEAPARITDRSKRTLVLRWKVPMRLGKDPVEVDGELWWRGQDQGDRGVIAPAFIGLGLLCLFLGGAAVVRRRQGHRGRGR